MNPRGPSHQALSEVLARDLRMRATRVPDDVVAAAREERTLRRLRRRIARWQRFGRVW